MSVVRLINKIYLSLPLCKEIIFFYDKSVISEDKITGDKFNKVCAKHNIDLCPTILFSFFDSVGIKIAIIPVGSTEFWSGRIYDNGQISISNDFISREDATLKTLEYAITIYNKMSKNEN